MKCPKNLAVLIGLLVVGTFATYWKLVGISSAPDVLRDALDNGKDGDMTSMQPGDFLKKTIEVGVAKEALKPVILPGPGSAGDQPKKLTEHQYKALLGLAAYVSSAGKGQISKGDRTFKIRTEESAQGSELKGMYLKIKQNIKPNKQRIKHAFNKVTAALDEITGGNPEYDYTYPVSKECSFHVFPDGRLDADVECLVVEHSETLRTIDYSYQRKEKHDYRNNDYRNDDRLQALFEKELDFWVKYKH